MHDTPGAGSTYPSTPAWMKWTGRVLSTLPILFMGGLGGFMFITQRQEMAAEFARRGWPAASATPLFAFELVAVLLYAIPQTAVLGAILLTGWLGGAVATHVQASEFAQAPVPVLFGIVIWLGLFLRDARVRALTPWRRL